MYRPQGLTILAFPSDEFGGQEIASEEIQPFVSSKFNVKFDILEKAKVNGPEAHPLFAWLKQAHPEDIRWNFATHWLVSADGETVKRFDKKKPMDLEAEIQDMLAAASRSDL